MQNLLHWCQSQKVDYVVMILDAHLVTFTLTILWPRIDLLSNGHKPFGTCMPSINLVEGLVLYVYNNRSIWTYIKIFIFVVMSSLTEGNKAYFVSETCVKFQS